MGTARMLAASSSTTRCSSAVWALQSAASCTAPKLKLEAMLGHTGALLGDVLPQQRGSRCKQQLPALGCRGTERVGSAEACVPST